MQESQADENDPTATSVTPPPKRVSQEDAEWVGCNQDVEATQLSSTKFAEHPKIKPDN